MKQKNSKPQTMKAVRVHPGTGLTVEQIERPVCPEDKVLLKIAYGGLCGSDLHYVQHGANGSYVIVEPLTLGHEVSGVVTELGSAITDTISLGKSATVHPAWPSPLPGQQHSGLHTFSGGSYLGSASTIPHTQGAFAEYVVVRPEQLRLFPEGVSLRAGVLAEPLAVALHAVTKLGNDAVRGQRVLVTGCGPIGLLTVLAISQHNPTELVVSDLSEHALSLAREFGATITLLAPNEQPEAQSIDIAIEASGSRTAMEGAFNALAAGGVLVQLAIPPSAELPVPIAEIIARELTLKGSWRFDGEIDDALKFLALHPEAERVISHEFHLDHASDAIATASNAQISSKVLLQIGSL